LLPLAVSVVPTATGSAVPAGRFWADTKPVQRNSANASFDIGMSVGK
jgi:hypothetical protein